MAYKNFIVNSANVTDYVQALANDVLELQEKVELLANGLETVTVANKKQLGPDAKGVLEGIDEFRSRAKSEYDVKLDASYANENGSLFAEQPYHNAEPEPEVPPVIDEPVSAIVSSTEKPGVMEDTTGHFVRVDDKS